MLKFLENKWISNPKYLFVLAMFNAALIMNFSDLFHAHPYLGLVAFVLSLIVLLNYKIWWAVIINVIINFIYAGVKFPRLSNHGNLEIFVSIALIGVICYKLLNKSVSISKDLLSFLFRFSVVTVYFYTGFHKLNQDFFNPCVSCTDAILNETFSNFTTSKIEFNTVTSQFFHYSTLFLEMVVPFGLLFSVSRKWSVIVILSFHFFLSLSFYADFSALAMFLMFCCCLNFDELENSKKHIFGLKCYLFFSISSFVITVLLERQHLNQKMIYFLSGCVYNIGFLFFVYYFFVKLQVQKNNFKTRYLFVIMPVVIIINFWTLRSYIGLGNLANFTMFSNLLTEKSRSNHLIINTNKTKLFDFEEDNILVLKLHDSIKANELIGYKIPLIEFRYNAKKWITAKKEVKLTATIVHNNDTIVIDDLKKSKYSDCKWWYKYLYFRKIQPKGANKCYW